MPVIDLTKQRAKPMSLEEALDRAGADGAVVLPVTEIAKLRSKTRSFDPEKVFEGARNGLLFLMQGRPGVMPEPQDGRQLVRVLREVADEIDNPTTEPEDYRRSYGLGGSDEEEEP